MVVLAPRRFGSKDVYTPSYFKLRMSWLYCDTGYLGYNSNLKAMYAAYSRVWRLKISLAKKHTSAPQAHQKIALNKYVTWYHRE